ncbi:MAG TPA: hypothetical protein VEQ58_21240, partial [Polyangiaceae bacterium]|nr:hypothetical protein [Polyangiaceae bacterium]
MDPAVDYDAPKPRFELSLVLLAVWLGLFSIAALPNHIRLFGYELTKSELTRFWDAPSIRREPPAEPLRAQAPAAAPAATERAAPPVDEAPQRILMIGDSMLDGLLP